MAEYNMSKERYTIGRLPDNDVRIDNPAVSGHHSLIINILNDSFLEDLNSTNGTYVNGKLIKKHALQHGDVITIGHHQLRFADQHTSDVAQDEFEKTMVIPAAQQDANLLAQAEKAADVAAKKEPQASPEKVSAKAAERVDVKVDMSELDSESAPKPEPKPEPKPKPEPAPKPISTADTGTAAGIDTSHLRTTVAADAKHQRTTVGVDPSMAPNALPMAKLQVLSGAFAGRELELSKTLTTLGRPGVQVAAITRRKEGYFVVHVESGEEGDYPLVNGQPIGAQARKLADNDVLQLAGVKMGFFAS